MWAQWTITIRELLIGSSRFRPSLILPARQRSSIQTHSLTASRIVVVVPAWRSEPTLAWRRTPRPLVSSSSQAARTGITQSREALVASQLLMFLDTLHPINLEATCFRLLYRST